MSFIYSQTNVTQALYQKYGISYHFTSDDRVEEWYFVLFIKVTNKDTGKKLTTFVSKKLVLKAFFKVRQNKAIQEQQNKNTLLYNLDWDFIVESSSGRLCYRITTGPLPSNIDCNCYDFIKQKQHFQGRGCCKHLYKYLYQLGFNSLRDYIKKIPKDGPIVPKNVQRINKQYYADLIQQKYLSKR